MSRRAVEIRRQNGGPLDFRVELDETRVEALGFEEAPIQRDVARQVKAVAADHLADAEVVRGRGWCGWHDKRSRHGGGEQALGHVPPRLPHSLNCPWPAPRYWSARSPSL